MHHYVSNAFFGVKVLRRMYSTRTLLARTAAIIALSRHYSAMHFMYGQIDIDSISKHVRIYFEISGHPIPRFVLQSPVHSGIPTYVSYIALFFHSFFFLFLFFSFFFFFKCYDYYIEPSGL